MTKQHGKRSRVLGSVVPPQDMARQYTEQIQARFGKRIRVSCVRGFGRGRPWICEAHVAGCLLGRMPDLLNSALDPVITDLENCLEEKQERLTDLQRSIPVLTEALEELRTKHRG